MKTKTIVVISLLALSGLQAFGQAVLSVEFDWLVSNGQSQYDASIVYSGGTTSGGVFTPTGLITYSFGTPFGIITPASHYPGFGPDTDTPYGPSFQTQGTITPILYSGSGSADPPYQQYSGDSLALDFKGQTEIISYFDSKLEPDIDLTGNWTEIITTAPDGGNSIVLLATALGGLALFRASHRPKSGAR